MKKTFIFLIYYFSVALCKLSAQISASDKINFITGQTWAQIREKATAENKYIFLDAFTTWCIPCMRMNKEIFTQKKVGDFFNENFINVKVQMDITKNDNEETKRWYRDARAISNQYNIDSYPTYLFFNPQGELVQRSNGSTASADEFINIAASAKGTYFVQKLNFDKGNRDQEFLSALIKTAQLVNDRAFIPCVVNAYLSIQTNLLTEDNIKLIAIATKRITDPGFPVLLSHPNDIDKVLGSGFSRIKSRTILFDEIALPYLRKDATIKDYGGGMVVYGGKLKDSVNWPALAKELDLNYPKIAKSVVFIAKLHYYESFLDWNNFVKTVSENEDNLDNNSLNEYARTIFHLCDDKYEIKQAIKWCDELMKKNEKNPDYSSTYANLLYKSGQTEKAIKVYEGLIKSGGDVYGNLSKTMEMMKAGGKTW